MHKVANLLLRLAYIIFSFLAGLTFLIFANHVIGYIFGIHFQLADGEVTLSLLGVEVIFFLSFALAAWIIDKVQISHGKKSTTSRLTLVFLTLLYGLPLALPLVGVYDGMKKDGSFDPLIVKEARRGKIDSVKRLLADGHNINSESYYCKTPLYYALDQHDLDMVALLIQNGASLDEPLCYSRYTPLGYAAYNADVEMVKLLLNLGADPLSTGLKDYTAEDWVNDRLQYDNGRQKDNFEEVVRLLRATQLQK